MRFRNAIFAGGGSRCFWQLGFWEGAKEAGVDLQGSVEFVGSTSAGCAMATAAVIDRARDALTLFQELTEENPRNIHWWNLHPFRNGSLFPHAHLFMNDAKISKTATGEDLARGALNGSYEASVDILSVEAQYTF